MNKLALAASVAVMAFSAVASAQNGYDQDHSSTTITSGPYRLKASTGNDVRDKMAFLMDHTLNSAEMETLRSMFRNMSGNMDYTIEKSIVNAVQNYSQNMPDYRMQNLAPGQEGHGLSDADVYMQMNQGLSWDERGVLHTWANHATSSQLMAVFKLVQQGGYAYSMWDQTSVGMNQ